MHHPIEQVARALARGDMAEADRLLAPVLSLAVELDGEHGREHQQRLSSQLPIELRALGVDPTTIACPPGLCPAAWKAGSTRWFDGSRPAFTMREVTVALDLLRAGKSQREVAAALAAVSTAGGLPQRDYSRGSVQAMCRRHADRVGGYYIERGELESAHRALDALTDGAPPVPDLLHRLRRALPPRASSHTQHGGA